MYGADQHLHMSGMQAGVVLWLRTLALASAMRLSESQAGRSLDASQLKPRCSSMSSTSSSEASVMRYAPPSSRHVNPCSAPPDASAAAASGPNGRPQNRSCSRSSLHSRILCCR